MSSDSVKGEQLLLQQNRRNHVKEIVDSMPYKDKIFWAQKRIEEFLHLCEKDNQQEVTISFSGGKDSTVLLDLVIKTHKRIGCKIPLVLIYATEITFPSTIKFINDTFNKYQKQYPLLIRKEIVNPKKTWLEILTQNGYPIYSKQISTLLNRVKRAKTKNLLTKWFFGIDLKINSTAKFKLSKSRLFLLDDLMLNSWPKLKDKEMQQYFKRYYDKYFFSEKCCDYIKGNLKHDYRPSFIGTMIEESELRKKSWIQHGCNIYAKNKMKSRPLSIWTAKNIWQYIEQNQLIINEAYGYNSKTGYDKQNFRFSRLGCTSCPYGSSIEQKRIEIFKQNNPNDTESYKNYNRFEILKKEYPNLYMSQVIYNGMYKVLIDMGILIHNDEMYMKLYELRHKQIDNWYKPKNFKTNILRVMAQIENYNDYKHKGKAYKWNYSIKEVNQAMEYFGFTKITKDDFLKIREDVANSYKKEHKL